MAIEIIKNPDSEPNAGVFNLPPSFDRKAYVSAWVSAGGPVQAKQERQYIPGTNYSADGWTVFKDPENGHKICKVATAKSGEFVLMMRPRAIQDAVNAICGNVGKQRMMSEKEGTTIGGQAPNDPGLLNAEQLSRVDGRMSDDDGRITLNPVRLDDARIPVIETQTT
jgi:hypothetical protein